MTKSSTLLNQTIASNSEAEGNTLNIALDNTQTFQITGDTNSTDIEVKLMTKVREDEDLEWSQHDSVFFDLTSYRNNSTTHPIDNEDSQIIKPVVINNGSNSTTIKVDEGRDQIEGN